MTDILDAEAWEEWLVARCKVKPPTGNLCYSDHRKNLAISIVERIKEGE